MARFIARRDFMSKRYYTRNMPAFTLYGARGSTNTDRVRLTLAEGGFTDYETVLFNLQKGEQKVSRPHILQLGTVLLNRSMVHQASRFSPIFSRTFNFQHQLTTMF